MVNDPIIPPASVVLRLHARNLQIQAAQPRCIPCDLGLTTDYIGAVNVTECKLPAPPSLPLIYPENVTCSELLLAFRNSTDELAFVGDGLCNPGKTSKRIVFGIAF